MISHAIRTRVELTRHAEKNLERVPRHIAVKLLAWVEAVETQGLAEVRKVPGYHDEPLKGDRVGQRSIRLSRSYRAIYEIEDGKTLRIIHIVEVTKHEY